MGKGRKPKKSFTMTLHFNTKQGIDAFKAWYLDSGGEQDFKYYTEGWGKDWMHLVPGEYACPECEYGHDEQEIYSKFYKERLTRKMLWTCGNCSHEYEVKNHYQADGT
jgi:hypothetical protein